MILWSCCVDFDINCATQICKVDRQIQLCAVMEMSDKSDSSELQTGFISELVCLMYAAGSVCKTAHVPSDRRTPSLLRGPISNGPQG